MSTIWTGWRSVTTRASAVCGPYRCGDCRASTKAAGAPRWATSRNASPSYRKRNPSGEAQSRSALSRMASKTGSTVVGEPAMTRRMAPLACSRSRAWVTSWNSRACPMAMAAWSAKLSRAAICPAVNRRTSRRRMVITPRTRSSLTRGTASIVRQPLWRLNSKPVGYSTAAASMSGMWTVRRSSAARPVAESRVSGMVSPALMMLRIGP